MHRLTGAVTSAKAKRGEWEAIVLGLSLRSEQKKPAVGIRRVILGKMGAALHERFRNLGAEFYRVRVIALNTV